LQAATRAEPGPNGTIAENPASVANLRDNRHLFRVLIFTHIFGWHRGQK